jgi:hypothetical protein
MMTMSLLLLALSPAASAAEPAAFEPLPTLDRWVLSEGVASHAATKTANGKKGGKKSGGKNNGGIDVPPGPQIPGWRTEYYIQPGAGVRLYQNGSGDTKTLATLGGEAGLTYRQKGKDLPKLVGRTRLSGEVMATGDLDKGLDVRAGSFIGPQWKNLGLQAGPDLFYNQWTFGSQVLDPSIGLEIPVTATLSGEKLTAFAGVSPALPDERRPPRGLGQRDPPWLRPRVHLHGRRHRALQRPQAQRSGPVPHHRRRADPQLLGERRGQQRRDSADP